MITQEQIDNLKLGDKLIFFRNGGVLSTNKGSVFTFSNFWYENNSFKDRKRWWQCQELNNIGNHEHKFSIYDTEIFNKNIHKDFVLMDEKKLISQKQDFIEKYGD